MGIGANLSEIFIAAMNYRGVVTVTQDFADLSKIAVVLLPEQVHYHMACT